jgi:pilus assembly protein CpaC
VRAKTGITIASFCALFLLLCAGVGLRAQTPPSPSQAAGASIQDSSNDLSVAVGKTVLVDVAWPIKRIANNLAEVADVHATSPTEVMVQGKTPGETSLIVWDTHGGRQFFNVTVRPNMAALNDSLDAIRRELRAELPGQTLKVSAENGSIFLRGTVKNLNSSERAVKIVTAGLPSGAVAVAGTGAGANASAAGGKVVNLLNVDVPESEPQILLKVRFASVDRSKEASWGINIFDVGGLNTVGGITTGQFSPPTVTSSKTDGASVAFTNELNLLAYPIGNLPFGVDIQALQTKGVVEVLAEPNIVAVNGKQASFLAGGEYPYPVVQGGSGGTGSSVTIMFKEYGVRLNFIPTITPRGTIRLQVAPEVSALDASHSVTVSGFNVPAITSRKMKTEVELADGQSFVVGGLLDNRDTETFEKIPFLGDIPILGKFFQSEIKTKTNTELIVIVTPEIVSPIQAGAPLPQLKTPGKFLPPNSGIPMNTPDAKTAENTPPPTPATIPVERLIDSMKPEPILVIEGGSGFAASSSSSNTGATPAYSPNQ